MEGETDKEKKYTTQETIKNAWKLLAEKNKDKRQNTNSNKNILKYKKVALLSNNGDKCIKYTNKKPSYLNRRSVKEIFRDTNKKPSYLNRRSVKEIFRDTNKKPSYL